MVKAFDELTTVQLYEILKARSAVFVVEQNCIYQDLDDVDYRSLHVFECDAEKHVEAYLRLFEKADEPGVVQMGRVLTVRRGEGLGGAILKEGIQVATERLGAKEIFLEAQVYAIGYYAKEGFSVCSEEFLEDGIPHVQMRMTV